MATPSLPGAMAPVSQKDLANRLAGGLPSNVHRRGTERNDQSIGLYCSDPAKWPVSAEGIIQPQVNWAGLAVPLHRANLHFLIAGVPGTGKTISFRMLLQSIFSAPARENLSGTDRAVIYDPKQEFIPILLGMGVADERIRIMNPFDARCHAWDLAADYRTPADAFQLARTMIPCPENLSQPFFPKAAAAVLTGVISALMQSHPDSWDLADLCLNCLSETRLIALLERATWNPYIELAKSTLGSADTKKNVLAELTAQIFEYLPIASRWRAAIARGRYLSLRAFLDSPDQILLLGANQTYSQSLKVMNQLLLKRLGELTMDHIADGQWDAENRTWLVLDELRELGKVPGLSDFINKGRSRGVCTVLGFQDYPGLKEAFGENMAHELTATCAHRFFLRLGGESAEWASKSIGKAEVVETNFSMSTGSSLGFSFQKGRQTTSTYSAFPSYSVSNSTSEGFNFTMSNNVTSSQQIRETDAVLASEISGLPSFEEGQGITGFVCQRSAEGKPIVQKLRYSWDLLRGLLPPKNVAGFIPWEQNDLEW
jgi:hypothetical protein